MLYSGRVSARTATMELMRVVVCVIIGCVELGSSIPYSDGNYGRNAHGAEWYTNQNFERPQNEYNSQHFSMMNRNGGEFIPRNNFQNNVPPSINNVPNNGYREYVSVPNYNSVNNMEPSSNNQMNYHHFERPIANAEASAFAGQNFNQENVNINKELAEINQMIAQENLAAIEREKLRESNFQQSYVSNVVQKTATD
ncbi:hypothetical protein EVAR_64025_1 [Eumeta japonica]|uniref:Uncharacterized protein n=1 Tax=Eumeta variegata TaxID=151549 RepID=A0A4C1Z610_EUMVA|nr:hypothetical protein EVAR_64025_1 [Eumeta japonica]